jgi:hypothetical protein
LLRAEHASNTRATAASVTESHTRAAVPHTRSLIDPSLTEQGACMPVGHEHASTNVHR